MKINKIAVFPLAVILAAGAFAVLPAEITGFDTALTASAETDSKGFIIETDEEGDSYIAGYEGKGGKITIPEGVSYIDYDAFKGNMSITAVTFPEGTTEYGIYDNAFEGCMFLKTVNIMGDCALIGKEAFKDCISLNSVKIGGNVEYGGEGGIYEGAFKNCHYLEKFSFAKEDALIDTIGKEAFMNCFALGKILLPYGLKTVGDDAFTNCMALSEVKIPAGVTEIGKYAFGYMLGYKDEKTVKSVIAGKSSASPVRYRANAHNTKEYDPKVKYVYAEMSSADENNKPSKAYTTVRQNEMSMTVAKGSAGEKWAKKYKLKYTSKAYGKDGKLLAPENLKASRSKDTVVLKWDKVDGADGYRIYMYDADKKEYVKYKTVSAQTCTVKKLESGTEYRFRVAAVEKSGADYIMGDTAKVSVTTKGEKKYPALPELSASAQKALLKDFAKFQGGKASDKFIRTYYGTYGGCEVVVMWDKTKPVTLDLNYISVGKYTVEIGSGSYTMYLHKDSTFIDIEQAYADGLITDADAAAIYYYSGTEEAYRYAPRG